MKSTYRLDYKKVYSNGKTTRPYIRFADEKEAQKVIEYLKRCTMLCPGTDGIGEFWVEDLMGNGKKLV